MIIKGDGSTSAPVRFGHELIIQDLFNKLKKLVCKLFNLNIETAHTFTTKLLRSEDMQEYFGIDVREQDYRGSKGLFY